MDSPSPTADRECFHSRLVAAHRDQVAAFVRIANEQNLDRLEAEVLR